MTFQIQTKSVLVIDEAQHELLKQDEDQTKWRKSSVIISIVQIEYYRLTSKWLLFKFIFDPLMNAWFSSLSVLKLWLHILSICCLSIPLIVFSIVFSVASEWLSWYFPLSFEHKLLFNTEKSSPWEHTGESIEEERKLIQTYFASFLSIVLLYVNLRCL